MGSEAVTPANFDMGRMLLSRLFSTTALIETGVLLALVGLMGYASARVLRRFPDLPHHREMLWGAHWGWAVFAGLVALDGGLLYLAILFTPWPLSAVLIFRGLLLPPFMLLIWRRPWHSNGALACILPLEARRRKQPFDADFLRAKQRRDSRWGLGGTLFALLLLVVSAVMVWRMTYPADLMMFHFRQAQVVQAALRGELPLPDALAVMAASPGVTNSWLVLVVLGPGASEARAREVWTLTREALARVGGQRDWNVVVNVKAAPFSVRGPSSGTPATVPSSGRSPAPAR